MLLRLAVITLCVAWTAGELQCAGPGRYSVTPGLCTSEYYTCNRDVNRDYIAYVLNCPGNTLFNERTRKCSSARVVNCVPPSHTSLPGQIKVTTPTRQKLTTQPTSSWISRPGYHFEFTTIRQNVEYRMPTRLPWVTPRPYLRSTFPTIKAKPINSQWRIRPSMTRKTRTTPRKPLLSPAKTEIRKTNHTSKRWKESVTSKNMKSTIYQHTMGQDINLTSPVYLTSDVVNFLTSTTGATASYIAEIPSPSHKKIVNVTTDNVPYSKSTNAVTLSMQTVPSKNINTTLSKTAYIPTYNTVVLKPASTSPSDVICHGQKTEITHGFVTPPYRMPTSPRTSNVENVFETTPEVILKDNKSPIPFMDSLEPIEQSADMEIVHVHFNSSSSSNNTMKRIKTGTRKPTKHILYFYDPDINHKINPQLVHRATNSITRPNKTNKQKIPQRRNRQPK